MNPMQIFLAKKDLRAITSNKRMFSVLLIVPLVLTIFLPSIFVLITILAPEDTGDFEMLLKQLPANMRQGDITHSIMRLVIDYIMPIFFLIIPIMAASVMAASSFVGEKEKRTLETLLYCPLTLQQIFHSKILASFIMSMMVSLISFISMIVVVEIELFLATGSILVPGISWLIIMLLFSPAVSLIAITLIVHDSAKSQTMEESQQRSAFLILPVVMLMTGQLSGVVLISPWVLMGLGTISALIALVLLKLSLRKFDYEMLLQ